MTEATLPARRGGGRPTLSALLLLALPVAAMLIFGMSLAFGVQGDDAWLLAAALTTGALALVPLALDQGRPPMKRHLLITLISLSYLMYFVLPVFTGYFWSSSYAESNLALVNLEIRDVLVGELTVLLGLISLLIGYSVPAGRLISDALPKPRREWSHQATLIVALVMIPLGWSVFGISIYGLLPKRLGSGFLGIVASSIYVGIALLMIAYLRFRSRPALLLMCVLIPPTMVVAFTTGSKRFFLLPLIMVALTHVLVTRRIRARYLVGGLLLITLLYPLSQFFREVVTMGQRLGPLQILQNPSRAIALMSEFLSGMTIGDYLTAGLQATGNRLNALGIVTVIVRDTPDIVPFQGGWTIGYAFLAFIPRLFWPGKPSITFGKWVTENYGAPGTDVVSDTGATWVGEFFFNFGFTGVLLGMAIIGIYFRALHESLFQEDSTIPATLTAVVVLLATAPAIEMGLVAPINGIIFTGGMVFMVHMVVRTFTVTRLSTPARASPQVP